MTTHSRPDPNETDTGRGFPRWLKWGLLGALGILGVGYGLIFLYAKVINDSPDELDSEDLAAALADDATEEAERAAETTVDVPEATPTVSTEPAVGEPTTAATEAPATTEPPATTEAPGAPAGAGLWNITDESELGYRVDEVLFGVNTTAAGRTNQIAGTLTIDGARVTDAEFTVDVASIESDDSRRDNQFRGRIMSTDEFPTATFTLTEPIELGTDAVEGAAVDTTATGELTLRGVSNPVTFDVSAELTNGRIGVLGRIPILFEDYEIDNPSVAGITTEDNGLLEFVLVFEPA